MVVMKAELMVNLTVVPIVDHMVSVSMKAGHVMALLTAMMAQMKLTANLQAVPMMSLTVVTGNVSGLAGHVTAGLIAQMAQMKLTVLNHVY